MVRLWLRCDRRNVLIGVWDGDDRMPEQQDVVPEAENGRGLHLVDAFSAAWGTYRPAGWVGKIVWCIVK